MREGKLHLREEKKIGEGSPRPSSKRTPVALLCAPFRIALKVAPYHASESVVSRSRRDATQRGETPFWGQEAIPLNPLTQASLLSQIPEDFRQKLIPNLLNSRTWNLLCPFPYDGLKHAIAWPDVLARNPLTAKVMRE